MAVVTTTEQGYLKTYISAFFPGHILAAASARYLPHSFCFITALSRLCLAVLCIITSRVAHSTIGRSTGRLGVERINVKLLWIFSFFYKYQKARDVCLCNNVLPSFCFAQVEAIIKLVALPLAKLIVVIGIQRLLFSTHWVTASLFYQIIMMFP